MSEVQLIKSASKTHVCHWCGEAIDKGEHYHRYRWFGDTTITVKMHPECLQAMRDMVKYEGGPIEWVCGEFERGGDRG